MYKLIKYVLMGILAPQRTQGAHTLNHIVNKNMLNNIHS